MLLFSWGGTSFPGGARDGFRCVVTSVRQQFTLFAPDGMPLRAKLTVELKEYKPLTDAPARAGLHVRRPHQGDRGARAATRIDAIAYREYGDPRQWRRIADENGIDDPLAVPAGRDPADPAGDLR